MTDSPPTASEPNPIERRRFPRLGISGRARIRNFLAAYEPFAESPLRDVSAGGARIGVSRLIERGERLVAELTLPGLARSIRTIAQVVWIDRARGGRGCECGLRFIGMLPEDREALGGYVERGIVPL